MSLTVSYKGVPVVTASQDSDIVLSTADCYMESDLTIAYTTGFEEPNVVTQTAPSALTLADNTEYYLANVSNLTLTYPVSGSWECWIRLTTASSGAVSVTFPQSSGYIGPEPSFSNSETWEISIKDGSVIAGKTA